MQHQDQAAKGEPMPLRKSQAWRRGETPWEDEGMQGERMGHLDANFMFFTKINDITWFVHFNVTSSPDSPRSGASLFLSGDSPTCRLAYNGIGQ